MTSPARAAAARANGAKSRGPVTARGKANSSRNAFRHGLRARTLFAAGKFADDNFAHQLPAILAGYVREFKPQSEIERALIEIMAWSHWRRTRMWKLERDLLSQEIRRRKSLNLDADHESDPAMRLALALAFRDLSDRSCVLQLLNRFESRYARSFNRAWMELCAIQAGQFDALENTFVDQQTQQPIEKKQPHPATPHADAIPTACRGIADTANRAAATAKPDHAHAPAGIAEGAHFTRNSPNCTQSCPGQSRRYTSGID